MPLYEAYGSRETSGVVSTSVGEDGVGFPIFCSEIRIIDGELMVRGTNVFRDNNVFYEEESDNVKDRMIYLDNFKNMSVNYNTSDCNQKVDEDETNNKEVLSNKNSKKWFRTGDGAEIRNGNIYIISRLEYNFKASLGEYIVPQKIENEYLSIAMCFTDIFITGSIKGSYIVALIVSKHSRENVEKDLKRIEKTKKERRVFVWILNS